MNALLKGLHPGVQFLLFIAMLLTFMGIGSLTALGIGTFVYNIPLVELQVVLAKPTPEYAGALLWMNNITQIFTFMFPVLAFYIVFGKENVHGFLLRRGGMLILLAPLLMFFAGGIFDLSSQLNHLLIPEGSWLERMFKPTEELAEHLTTVMLSRESGLSPIVVFLSIAIIPAFCEELTFRGVVQPLLAKMTKNIHIAIWLTAALFSLIHMQFYGFLPRLLMGAMLGYMVIWSGSLWASIFAHFLNNAVAIIMYYQYGSLEAPDGAAMSQWYSYLFSTVLLVFLIIHFIRHSRWPWLSFEYLGITSTQAGNDRAGNS